MIGVASAATLLFSVPGIPLIVKETHGYPFFQKAVDEIIIYPAERYDFELDLRNVSPGRYNMTVEILEGKEIKKTAKYSWTRFRNRNRYTWAFHWIKCQSTKAEISFKLPVFSKEPDAKCITVSYLKSTNHSKDFDFDLAQRSNETLNYFLNFGVP